MNAHTSFDHSLGSRGRILRMNDLAKRCDGDGNIIRRGETGLSRTSIWRRIKEGTFPAPHRLGANSVGWFEADIERWKSELPTSSI